ncbi:MAG: DUF2948 family protein [Alphaproteobacteria bacterium]
MDAHVPLSIKANDGEELFFLSSYLQDSLISSTSVHFNPITRNFSCVLNRFCWEHEDDYTKHKSFYRVHSALIFHKVVSAHHKGLDLKSPLKTYNLLAILLNSTRQKENLIHCCFSNNKEILIKAKNLDCRMHDIDSPWPTQNRPIHNKGPLHNPIS